jgi:hypothetical protein
MPATIDAQGNVIPEGAPPAPTGMPPVPPVQGYPQQLPLQQPPGPRFYSEEELAAERDRVAQETKAALSPELQAARQRLKELEDADAARVAQANEAAAQAAAAAQAKADEEKSAKDLLLEERAQRLAMEANFKEELSQRDAILAREREFAGLQVYKAQVLAANADQILPEFADLIGGNTEEEINASVQGMIQRTQAVLQNFGAAQQEGQRQMPTVSPNSPAIGPEGWLPGSKTYTAAQIAAMNMTEYSDFRQKIGMGNGQGRGLY